MHQCGLSSFQSILASGAQLSACQGPPTHPLTPHSNTPAHATNRTCMIIPQGYGKALISMSYELSKIEGKVWGFV